MIDDHQFCQIKDWQEPEGLKGSQIAAVLDLDPKTVTYWLGQERFRPRQSPRARVNAIRLSPRFARCSRRLPIGPPRSGSA